jgi:hypothetical protein
MQRHTASKWRRHRPPSPPGSATVCGQIPHVQNVCLRAPPGAGRRPPLKAERHAGRSCRAHTRPHFLTRGRRIAAPAGRAIIGLPSHSRPCHINKTCHTGTDRPESAIDSPSPARQPALTGARAYKVPRRCLGACLGRSRERAGDRVSPLVLARPGGGGGCLRASTDARLLFGRHGGHPLLRIAAAITIGAAPLAPPPGRPQARLSQDETTPGGSRRRPDGVGGAQPAG